MLKIQKILLKILLVCFVTSYQELPTNMQQNSILYPGMPLGASTDNILTITFSSTYNNPKQLVSIAGFRFTQNFYVGVYIWTESVTSSGMIIKLDNQGPITLEFLRLNYLIYEYDDFFVASYQQIQSYYVYFFTSIISIARTPPAQQQETLLINRANYLQNYANTKCHFLMWGFEMDSDFEYVVDVSCSINQLFDIDLLMKVGALTHLSTIHGLAVVINQNQLLFTQQISIIDQSRTITSGVLDTTYQIIDTSTKLYLFGITSFYTLPTNYYIDINNNPSTDIYPATPTNSFIILTFSQYRCNQNQLFNHLTKMCDSVLSRQYLTGQDFYRQSQFSTGMKYIALTGHFSIQIYQYNSMTLVYEQKMQVKPFGQMYNVRFNSNFNFIAVSNQHTVLLMTKLNDQAGYSIIHQIKQSSVTSTKKDAWISDDGQIFITSIYNTVDTEAIVWKFNSLRKVYEQNFKISNSAGKVKISADGRFIFIIGNADSIFQAFYDENSDGFYISVYKSDSPKAFEATKDGNILFLYYSEQPSAVLYWNNLTQKFDLHHNFLMQHFASSVTPLFSISDNGLKLITTANVGSKKSVFLYNRLDLSLQFQLSHIYMVGDAGLASYYDASISSDGSMLTIANGTQNVLIMSLSTSNMQEQEIIPNTDFNIFDTAIDEANSSSSNASTGNQSQNPELQIAALATSVVASMGLSILGIVYLVYEKCKVPQMPNIAQIYDSMNIQAPKIPQNINIEANIQIKQSKQSEQEQKNATQQHLKQKSLSNIIFYPNFEQGESYINTKQ